MVMEIVQTVPETNLIEGNKPSTAKEEKEPTIRKKQATPPPKPPAARPAPAPEPMPKAKAKPAPDPTPAPKSPSPAAEVIPEKPTVKPKLSKAEAVQAPKAKPRAMPKALPKPKPKRQKNVASAEKPTPPSQRLKNRRPPSRRPPKKRRIIWSRRLTSWSRMNRNANRLRPVFSRILPRSRLRQRRLRKSARNRNENRSLTPLTRR